jgi:hypothetical protein
MNLFWGRTLTGPQDRLFMEFAVCEKFEVEVIVGPDAVRTCRTLTGPQGRLFMEFAVL